MDGGRRPPPNAPADAASPCSTRSMGATKRLLRRRRRCAAWSLSCSWRPTRLASTAGHPPPALCSERSASADQTRYREAPCRPVFDHRTDAPDGSDPALRAARRGAQACLCFPLPTTSSLWPPRLLYRARMVPTRHERTLWSARGGHDAVPVALATVACKRGQRRRGEPATGAPADGLAPVQRARPPRAVHHRGDSPCVGTPTRGSPGQDGALHGRRSLLGGELHRL